MRSALSVRHIRSLRLPTLAVAVTVVSLFLASASPAAAHPYFRGGEAPVDSLASLTLELGHGCGTEGDGGADTTEVALEVPEWMRVIALHERSGWEIAPERDADGDIEVVTWRAAGADEPAPAFELDVVIGGEPGEERFLAVFQACGDVVHRWVGTPDEPADEPAISLILLEADPERPPPPEAEPDPGPETDVASEQAPSQPGDDPAASDPETDVAGEDEVTPTAGEAPFPWVATVVVVVVLAAGAVTWRLRGRRRRADPT